MTDTLHSRILRTIEDWNTDHSMGLGPGDTAVLAGRVSHMVDVNTVTKVDLANLRQDLGNAIKTIDRTLTLASNSDAEKERDEFALKFADWLIRSNATTNDRLEIFLERFKEVNQSKP